MIKGVISILPGVFLFVFFSNSISAQTGRRAEKRVSQANRSINAEIREEGMVPATLSGRIPYDYLNLLRQVNPALKSKLRLDRTLIFKYRYPVSDFLYDNNYYLQLYKIGYLGKTPIGKAVLKTDQNFSKEHSHLTYSINQQGVFNFMYCTCTKLNPTDIHLDMFGDGTKTLAVADTIAYYYSNLKTLAIKYSLNEPMDMFIKGNSSGISYTIRDRNRFSYTKPLPFETLFLKRNGQLYVLFFSVKNPKIKLQPGMLLRLLDGGKVG